MKIEKHITITETHDIDITEITLLSLEEARDINLLCVGAWWWLRSPGNNGNLAAFVDGAGSVLIIGCIVNNQFGVRPALRIRDPESSNLTIGDKFTLAGHYWTVINENLALCDDIVGKTCFRRDCGADDANVYEASDVKKWLENWAAEHWIKIKGE